MEKRFQPTSRMLAAISFIDWSGDLPSPHFPPGLFLDFLGSKIRLGDSIRHFRDWHNPSKLMKFCGKSNKDSIHHCLMKIGFRQHDFGLLQCTQASPIFLGGDMSALAFFGGSVIGFCFVGMLLGIAAAVSWRRRHIRLGMGIGTAVGCLVSLGLAIIGNRAVAANPRSSSDNVDALLNYCALGLACVVLGAIIGGVMPMILARLQNRSTSLPEILAG